MASTYIPVFAASRNRMIECMYEIAQENFGSAEAIFRHADAS